MSKKHKDKKIVVSDETVTAEIKIEEKPKETLDSLNSMESLSENETFPEVSEHAINAVADKEAEKVADAEKAEKEGIKLNKDGTPAKKRGRKPSSFNDPRKTVETDQKPGVTKVSSIYAAQVVSGIIENISINAISKDWKLSEPEKLENVTAWCETFDHYGGLELTPPQRLMLSHGAIILTRVGTSKETQTKLSLGKAWFKMKIAKFKNRKGKKDALSNTGADAERKNDMGEKEITGS